MTDRVRPTDSGAAAWIAYIVLALVWGSAFVALKVGVEALPPITFTGYRFAAAGLLLALILTIRRQRIAPDRATAARIAGLAIVSPMIPFVMITWAAQYLNSGLVAILTCTIALFSVIIARFLLPAERLTRAGSVGILVGFVGVAVLMVPRAAADQSAAAGGADDPASLGVQAGAVLACLVASVLGGLSIVLARRSFRTVPALQFTCPTLLAAGFAGIALALVIERTPDGLLAAPTDPRAVASIGWMAITNSIVGLTLFYWLLARWGVGPTSTVNYLVPAIAIAIGVVVLGEALEPTMLLGGALIVGGVILANARGVDRRR